MLGMLKIERYALPNVLAGEDLAPELVCRMTARRRTSAGPWLRWLNHPRAVTALQPKYLEFHRVLRQDASASAANAVAELIQVPVGAT
jgi:lipid-A-disaccharide synthase